MPTSLVLGGLRPGTYCDTIGSCDSVICTTLTVNVVTYLVINDTVALCAGDSAFAGGAYQYNAGFYLDTVGNNFGQDTIYSTEIVVDLNSVQIYSSGLWLKSNQSVGPFQWYDCNSQTVIMTTGVGYMMPGYSGSFALINQSATCNDTSVCVNHANTSNKTGLDVRGYPTTVSEQYSISFSSVQKDVSIDLFDIQGQLIQTWKEQDVDLITLPMEHPRSRILLGPTFNYGRSTKPEICETDRLEHSSITKKTPVLKPFDTI